MTTTLRVLVGCLVPVFIIAISVSGWLITVSQFGELQGLERRVFRSIVCSDTITSEAVSPDKQYIAEVIKRNCGAMARWMTAVRLRYQRDWFLSGRSREILGYYGLPPVTVSWKDNTELEIGLGCTTRYRHASWEGVTIEYQEVEGLARWCSD